MVCLQACPVPWRVADRQCVGVVPAKALPAVPLDSARQYDPSRVQPVWAARSDRESGARSSSSSFAWPRRTVIGVMPGSLGRWPIWDIRSAIRRSAMSCNATDWHRHRSASARHMGGLHSDSPGALGGDRLFHRGSADAARAGDYVLFFIHLDSRRVDIAGITIHPDELWMKQIARNVTIK